MSKIDLFYFFIVWHTFDILFINFRLCGIIALCVLFCAKINKLRSCLLFSCLYIVVTYHWHFDCYTTPVILYFKIYGPLKRIRIGSYVVVYVYIASFMNKKKSVAICIIDNIKPGLGILCLDISTWYPYYLWQKKSSLMTLIYYRPYL